MFLLLRGNQVWTFPISVAFVLLHGLASNTLAIEEVPPFTVPDGFSVQKVADDSLVHDCFCMTLDGLGRPVVSGPGYIRTLLDDNSDGQFDRSVLWSNLPKQGAQGLWAEGIKLYFVSEGGLWMTEDSDGDLVADANAKRVLDLPTGSEHDSHALRKGPDGYWYLIAGNFARDISKMQNDPNSPVQRSRSGTLWRISPDFSTRSVWAHGMRNCYDFDFLPNGQIVTFDSDCEREATLPWYRPTRVMVLGPGADAGWCGQAWKDEDHRITMPLTLAQLGRGSPTGVAVYRHRAFPKKYHNAIFALDWTFGRVLAIYPSSNLDESKRIPNKIPAEIFMQPSGMAGFAPTDVCVAQDGSLLICIGGRGTTGAVYRVTSNESIQAKSPGWFTDSIASGQLQAEQAEALENLLRANSPLDSWSEAKWRPNLEKVGISTLLATIAGTVPISAEPDVVAEAKLKGAQFLTRYNANIPFASLQGILLSPSQSSRASGWWLVGRGRLSLKPQETKWIESLAATDYSLPESTPNQEDASSWEPHLGRDDERLRWEAFGIRKWNLSSAESRPVTDNDAGNALRRTWLWALSRSPAPLAAKSNRNGLDTLIARQLFNTSQTGINSPLLDALATWVPANQATLTTRDKLELLTLLQSALGDRRYSLPQQLDPPQPDVLDGYRGLSSARLPDNVRTAWIGWAAYFAKLALKEDSPLIQLEATRTMAMLEPKDQGSIELLLSQIDQKSHPTSDIHWLCCLANCSSPRTSDMTRATAAALSGLVRKVKLRGLYTDNQWPTRLQQLINALTKRDSRLGKAFVELPVPCCPEDIVLISSFPVDVQKEARKKMREHLIATAPTEWQPVIVRYACQLGIDESFANSIRKSAIEPNNRSLATEMLSSLGEQADYELFLAALDSSDRNQWPFGWKGISTLPVLDPAQEWKTIPQIVSNVINTTIALPRTAVLSRARTIAAKLKMEKVPTTEQWSDWDRFFQGSLDEAAYAKLRLPSTNSDWRAIVLSASSLAGDLQVGKSLYEQKCGLCHGGQSALGPSLLGVAKRFSREDLSKAIFEPSRDISDRYRSIRVLTMDGEIFTGMIIYNAADGTTLQTADGNLVRINQDNIEDKAYSTESLMPSGLLDDRSPAEVASLYAYLGTLQ